MKWWLRRKTDHSSVERAATVLKAVRDQDATLRSRTEELREAADALIKVNERTVHGDQR